MSQPRARSRSFLRHTVSALEHQSQTLRVRHDREKRESVKPASMRFGHSTPSSPSRSAHRAYAPPHSHSRTPTPPPISSYQMTSSARAPGVHAQPHSFRASPAPCPTATDSNRQASQHPVTRTPPPTPIAQTTLQPEDAGLFERLHTSYTVSAAAKLSRLASEAISQPSRQISAHRWRAGEAARSQASVACVRSASPTPLPVMDEHHTAYTNSAQRTQTWHRVSPRNDIPVCDGRARESNIAKHLDSKKVEDEDESKSRSHSSIMGISAAAATAPSGLTLLRQAHTETERSFLQQVVEPHQADTRSGEVTRARDERHDDAEDEAPQRRGAVGPHVAYNVELGMFARPRWTTSQNRKAPTTTPVPSHESMLSSVCNAGTTPTLEQGASKLQSPVSNVVETNVTSSPTAASAVQVPSSLPGLPDLLNAAAVDSNPSALSLLSSSSSVCSPQRREAVVLSTPPRHATRWTNEFPLPRYSTASLTRRDGLVAAHRSDDRADDVQQQQEGSGMGVFTPFAQLHPRRSQSGLALPTPLSLIHSASFTLTPRPDVAHILATSLSTAAAAATARAATNADADGAVACTEICEAMAAANEGGGSEGCTTMHPVCVPGMTRIHTDTDAVLAAASETDSVAVAGTVPNDAGSSSSCVSPMAHAPASSSTKTTMRSDESSDDCDGNNKSTHRSTSLPRPAESAPIADGPMGHAANRYHCSTCLTGSQDLEANHAGVFQGTQVTECADDKERPVWTVTHTIGKSANSTSNHTACGADAAHHTSLPPSKDTNSCSATDDDDNSAQKWDDFTLQETGIATGTTEIATASTLCTAVAIAEVLDSARALDEPDAESSCIAVDDTPALHALATAPSRQNLPNRDEEDDSEHARTANCSPEPVAQTIHTPQSDASKAGCYGHVRHAATCVTSLAPPLNQSRSNSGKESAKEDDDDDSAIVIGNVVDSNSSRNTCGSSESNTTGRDFSPIPTPAPCPLRHRITLDTHTRQSTADDREALPRHVKRPRQEFDATHITPENTEADLPLIYIARALEASVGDEEAGEEGEGGEHEREPEHDAYEEQQQRLRTVRAARVPVIAATASSPSATDAAERTASSASAARQRWPTAQQQAHSHHARSALDEHEQHAYHDVVEHEEHAYRQQQQQHHGRFQRQRRLMGVNEGELGQAGLHYTAAADELLRSRGVREGVHVQESNNGDDAAEENRADEPTVSSSSYSSGHNRPAWRSLTYSSLSPWPTTEHVMHSMEAVSASQQQQRQRQLRTQHANDTACESTVAAIDGSCVNDGNVSRNPLTSITYLDFALHDADANASRSLCDTRVNDVDDEEQLNEGGEEARVSVHTGAEESVHDTTDEELGHNKALYDARLGRKSRCDDTEQQGNRDESGGIARHDKDVGQGNAVQQCGATSSAYFDDATTITAASTAATDHAENVQSECRSASMDRCSGTASHCDMACAGNTRREACVFHPVHDRMGNDNNEREKHSRCMHKSSRQTRNDRNAEEEVMPAHPTAHVPRQLDTPASPLSTNQSPVWSESGLPSSLGLMDCVSAPPTPVAAVIIPSGSHVASLRQLIGMAGDAEKREVSDPDPNDTNDLQRDLAQQSDAGHLGASTHDANHGPTPHFHTDRNKDSSTDNKNDSNSCYGSNVACRERNAPMRDENTTSGTAITATATQIGSGITYPFMVHGPPCGAGVMLPLMYESPLLQLPHIPVSQRRVGDCAYSSNTMIPSSNHAYHIHSSNNAMSVMWTPHGWCVLPQASHAFVAPAPTTGAVAMNDRTSNDAAPAMTMMLWPQMQPVPPSHPTPPAHENAIGMPVYPHTSRPATPAGLGTASATAAASRNVRSLSVCRPAKVDAACSPHAPREDDALHGALRLGEGTLPPERERETGRQPPLPWVLPRPVKLRSRVETEQDGLPAHHAPSAEDSCRVHYVDASPSRSPHGHGTCSRIGHPHTIESTDNDVTRKHSSYDDTNDEEDDDSRANQYSVVPCGAAHAVCLSPHELPHRLTSSTYCLAGESCYYSNYSHYLPHVSSGSAQRSWNEPGDGLPHQPGTHTLPSVNAHGRVAQMATQLPVPPGHTTDTSPLRSSHVHQTTALIDGTTTTTSSSIGGGSSRSLVYNTSDAGKSAMGHGMISTDLTLSPATPQMRMAAVAGDASHSWVLATPTPVTKKNKPTHPQSETVRNDVTEETIAADAATISCPSSSAALLVARRGEETTAQHAMDGMSGTDASASAESSSSSTCSVRTHSAACVIGVEKLPPTQQQRFNVGGGKRFMSCLARARRGYSCMGDVQNLNTEYNNTDGEDGSNDEYNTNSVMHEKEHGKENVATKTSSAPLHEDGPRRAKKRLPRPTPYPPRAPSVRLSLGEEAAMSRVLDDVESVPGSTVARQKSGAHHVTRNVCAEEGKYLSVNCETNADARVVDSGDHNEELHVRRSHGTSRGSSSRKAQVGSPGDDVRVMNDSSSSENKRKSGTSDSAGLRLSLTQSTPMPQPSRKPVAALRNSTTREYPEGDDDDAHATRRSLRVSTRLSAELRAALFHHSDADTELTHHALRHSTGLSTEEPSSVSAVHTKSPGGSSINETTSSSSTTTGRRVRSTAGEQRDSVAAAGVGAGTRKTAATSRARGAGKRATTTTTTQNATETVGTSRSTVASKAKATKKSAKVSQAKKKRS